MIASFAAFLGVAVALAATALLFFLVIRPLRREAEERAERLRQEARVEVAERRAEAEAEIRERQNALGRVEERLLAREEALEVRRAHLEEREAALVRDQRSVLEKSEGLDRRLRQADEDLQRIANLTKTQARDHYLKKIETEYRELGQRRGREAEAQTAAEAERRARKMVLDIVQRTATAVVSQATLAVVEIPNEEMKGRLIGREGRNIRAFEQTTGTDLIIDETPDAVVVSCFDPVRREIARVTLMNLMLDGRIHPGRIEELHEKATAEVQRALLEAGQRAAENAGVEGLTERTVEVMGRLRFRTSLAQNVLDHSVEVAKFAENLAHELGLNVEVARRAGFLHDIGKALGPEWEGPHALTGMEFLRSQGEKEPILLAVGAHHRDIEPTSAESVLVIVADGISASRPGARRENLENHVRRMQNLEILAGSYPGVDRAYAVQSGREVRLIVRPGEVDDAGAVKLANDVARRIEREGEIAGQVRVTVIRETRFTATAK